MTKARMSGWIITWVVVLFMLFDSISKIIRESHVLMAMAQLGWPDELTTTLGVVELICVILYAIPQSSVLGAILLTAWLGGATAEKFRHEDVSLFFSVVVGILVWLALFLRSRALRSVIPYTKKENR